MRGFNIGLFVTDQEAGVSFYRKIRHGLKQHSGLGFAIETVFSKPRIGTLGVERAGVDGIHSRPCLGKAIDHMRMDRVHVRLCVMIKGDAGLIGDDEDEPIPRFEAGDAFACTIDPLPVFHSVNLAMIDVDDAVSIKEEGRSQFSHGFD